MLQELAQFSREARVSPFSHLQPAGEYRKLIGFLRCPCQPSAVPKTEIQYPERSVPMSLRPRQLPLRSVVLFLFLNLLSVSIASAQITTYHVDNNRTGWNPNETVLTPANVSPSSFGLLHNIRLDDQVDSQPLYVPNVTITAGSNQGQHNVVYVASENNSVYAIDAATGTVLLSPNFGKPVTYPIGCGNNGPHVGINSTPVIDLTSNTMYVVIYNQTSKGPAYQIHALDLGSLTDKVTPQTVAASHTLTDGTTFDFNATYQRQRPGLLLSNGVVYAGFGSFCDLAANLSRGWLLGWATDTMTPLASNQLNDTQVTSPDSFFLSSIWMSGYAPSVDDSGNILFVTGNSDYSGTTYDGVTNIQESVVKISSDLSTVLDLFTPRNQASLDGSDADFGSGGVMVLPDQPGSTPHLAVAAGKVGSLFLMNEDSLGGYNTKINNVLGTYGIGSCWCGPSYYVDPSDGVGRVVTSGSHTAEVYKVVTSPSPALTKVSSSPALITGPEDGGFFTSISSNGTSNPIIWALSRPTNATAHPIYLYAFNPESVTGGIMQELVKIEAGIWPNTGGNANLVPMVANGEVFVASHDQIQIFGIKAGKKK
jgi:hypothetical protein